MRQRSSMSCRSWPKTNLPPSLTLSSLTNKLAFVAYNWLSSIAKQTCFRRLQVFSAGWKQKSLPTTPLAAGISPAQILLAWETGYGRVRDKRSWISEKPSGASEVGSGFTNFISQNVFINSIEKVYSSKKSSTYRLILLSMIFSWRFCGGVDISN